MKKFFDLTTICFILIAPGFIILISYLINKEFTESNRGAVLLGSYCVAFILALILKAQKIL